ncbi:hypothetical protein T440DRAFT_465517 [Plenodomus tracheiphilus IPT5]|uniref:Uncharacterized protein n=1 Tax=Plenodomus tracheiphilus IPT5 TaxID=1408161 RepID=A0A6A7BEQ9_9PLEO|nr:hypothetical protein T440DRAFT_465517 [Plenodomus tracheiphilus IPT5]
MGWDTGCVEACGELSSGGEWEVYVDHRLVRTEDVRGKDGIEVEVEIWSEAVDVVFLRGW